MIQEDPDLLASRVPCPDGTCTGLVGDHGRCGTCGRAGVDGALPSSCAAPVPPPSRAVQRASIPDEDEASLDRVPCHDGTCTGVLGTDGACGTCGLRVT